MKIEFTKMHGLGNDYIYIDCMRYTITEPEKLSERLSDRHRSVGGDGIILICSSDIADFKMRIFNADGSEAKMCGNGIRCVGKYVYDKGLTDKRRLDIETASGVKHLELIVQDGEVTDVCADMGKAELRTDRIPMLTEYTAGKGKAEGQFINGKIDADGTVYTATCVSMGNPHCVVFEDADLYGIDLAKAGRAIEIHQCFPDRVNAEFVNAVAPDKLYVRVWERGSGETMACGTGACAVAVAAVINGYCEYDTDITVGLPGGELKIRYKKDGSVFMTGPACTAFEGYFEL